MMPINSTENKSLDNEKNNNDKNNENKNNENKIEKKEKNIKVNKEKKYLGKRGYIINKSFFEENELQEIRDELSVTPFSNMDYGIPETPFKVFKENSTHMHLPKYYGNNKFGKCDINVVPEGGNIDLKFNLQLKEEQKLPAEKTIESYHKDGGGILTLPCGFGKTILALYFISVLQKKTLVIVHKEFLMNQWVERIQFALPDARIGIIQGSKCEIENKDIIIGMLQTLSMREFDKDTFDTIGHVIIDECHRIPSRIFSQALFRIHSKYMLGLSATPNRKDGLTKILKWFAGDIIYSVKTNEKNIVRVERYLLQSDNDNYNQEVLSFRGQVQMATMVNNISSYLKRTKIIIDLVVKELNAHESRQILILSDRKQQLKDMENLLIEAKIENVGYYVGGMKKEKLKENEKCRVLLGTFPMASEGLDIPSLNGLVLATPKSDIIQTVGRISRIKHENIQALIIDMVDCFSLFEKQSKKRLDIYKKKGYEVEDIKYNVETNNVLGRKKYFFHNVLKKEQDNDDNDDDDDDDDKKICTNFNKNNFKNTKKTKNNEIDFENMDPKTYKINLPKENKIISFFS
jgi:superfamily II DNA or RNA helicase